MNIQNLIQFLKRMFLCCGCLFLFFFGTVGASQIVKPNIIVILVDDLGYADHSLSSHSTIKTPGLERLARSGIIFDAGFVSHPYCGPSRAGLLTGRHQARFGMETNPSYSPYDSYHGLPLDEKLLSEYLSESGYRTGIFGKWHMGAAPEYHPLNRGFDSFYGFLSGGHDYFQVDTTRAHTKNGQLLYSEIEGATLPLSKGTSTVSFEGYLTDALTTEAIEFINAESENPFFLYLSYNAPHGPLQAPKELVDKYSDAGDWARATYLAMVDSLDQNVERLLKELDRNGLYDNSLIFFLSDNGGVYASESRRHENWANNFPLRGGKGSFYEGGIRVPFIASWPAKWPTGKRYSPMVSSLDIATTAIAAAGFEGVPESALDGVDLTPYLTGKVSGSPHAYLFWRSAYNNSFAVRSNDSKLLLNAASGNVIEFYDLKADPTESNTVTSSFPREAMVMSEAWNQWNLGNIENASMEAFEYQKTRDQFFRDQAEALQAKALKRKPFQIKLKP